MPPDRVQRPIRMDKELSDWIDQDRGDIPFNAYMINMIWEKRGKTHIQAKGPPEISVGEGLSKTKIMVDAEKLVRDCLADQNPSDELVEKTAEKIAKPLEKYQAPKGWNAIPLGKEKPAPGSMLKGWGKKK